VTEERLQVTVDERRSVSALVTGAGADWTFIYAPGAGANLNDPFGVFLSEALPPAGVAVVRFQFPYQEAGRSGPDANPVLESTWRAVIERFRPGNGKLAVGGRSMGGRIASQVVADGAEADALACFAYPLHPPGKPQQRRDSHLARIAIPALLCSATRDDFATTEEIEALTKVMPRASVHFLEGADHGFNVRKSSGRTRHDVWQEASEALLVLLGEAGR
jgi:uncharacterized protein